MHLPRTPTRCGQTTRSGTIAYDCNLSRRLASATCMIPWIGASSLSDFEPRRWVEVDHDQYKPEPEPQPQLVGSTLVADKRKAKVLHAVC